MVKLIIEDDEGKTTVVPLIRDEITIGRKEGNTIRLTERNVSRRHAKLLKQNGAIFIEDLNSYNGIKVNGNKIAGRVAITEGDRIQIGDYVLGLKMEGVAEQIPTEPQSTKTVELPKPQEAPTAQIDLRDAQTAVTAADAVSAPVVTPPAAIRADTAGRLVCVSTNFPGQEWLLNKSLMVIGRTEDNDVVVNHRSISRHHARITEENGRYTIIDLQSSNGVRVNGEEYGKVELRRGDLIDLGHVRLRFVAAGEDFVFSRDASVVDISKVGSSRGTLWVALAVVFVVGICGVIWYLTKTPSGGSSSADAQAIASGDSHRAAADPLTEINTAISGENWATAVTLCAALKPEQKKPAQTNCEKATKEKDAKERWEKITAASLQHDNKQVLEQWTEIPDDSIYKKKAQSTVDKAKKDYQADASTKLDEAIAAKECEKAKTLAAEIKKLIPDDTTAEEKAKTCKEAVVAVNPDIKPEPKVRPHPKVPKVPKKVPKKEQPTPIDQAKIDELLKKAGDAFVGGNSGLAQSLARQVLRSSPGHVGALRILGLSACSLKDRKTAQSCYEKLPSATRQMLKGACQKYEINLQ
jgi:ABC transport system ATP-binding/permease protein